MTIREARHLVIGDAVYTLHKRGTVIDIGLNHTRIQWQSGLAENMPHEMMFAIYRQRPNQYKEQK